MGSWGASLGGAITGLGDYAHEQNLLKLQQHAADKSALMDFFKEAMQKPEYQFMVPDLAQHYMDIVNTDLSKWDRNKMAKSHDFATIAQKAWDAHGQQHPGMQQAQQTQLPIANISAAPGQAGQSYGDADGAAHQAAMQTPGAGATPQPQPQQTITPPPMAAQSQQPQQAQQPMQPPPVAQTADMLAGTTAAMQGNLPNPTPIPQVSPSPAQASAAAGTDFTQYIGPRPQLTHHATPFLTREEQLQRDEEIKRMQDYDQQLAELQRATGLNKFQMQQRQEWLKSPEGQAAVKQYPWLAAVISAPPGVTIPNMSSMMTPHLIGSNVSGADAAAGTLDNAGNPIDPQKNYTVRQINGQEVWVPTQVRQQMQWMADPKDPSKMVLIRVNPLTGTTELVQDASRLNPAMIPQVSTSMRIVPQEDGSLAAVPVTSTSQKIPPGGKASSSGGGASAGAATITPPPNAGGKTGTGAAGTGAAGPRVVGQTISRTKMEAENPLTPEGQKIVADIEPRLKMVRRLEAYIKSQGWDKESTPMTTFLPRMAYAMGYGGDTGGFLSQLELGRITQGAGVLKGSSRAIQALNKAMVHTPDAWKDSGKLMLDKLTQIETSLQDIQDSARKEMQRYPGLSKSPAETGSGGSNSNGGSGLPAGWSVEVSK